MEVSMLPVSKALFYTITLSLILAPTMHIKAAAELKDDNQENTFAADEANNNQQNFLAHYKNDLITTVAKNNSQAIRALLSHAQATGANTAWLIDSIITHDGDPILHVAARHKDGLTVKALLDHKANPNIAKPDKPHKGKVALHGAAKRGSAAVKLLLEAQADPNVQIEGQLLTPLHLAFSENALETLSLLLLHGANPDMQDSLGETALHQAARCSGNPALAIQLVHFKASPTIRNKKGELPQDVATNASVRTVVEPPSSSASAYSEAPHHSWYERAAYFANGQKHAHGDNYGEYQK